MSTELNIYTLRPDRTSLWLPELLAAALGIKRGDQLTEAQYQHAEVQGVIARRLAAERTGKAAR